jgi:signal transduction histidine kinase
VAGRIPVSSYTLLAAIVVIGIGAGAVVAMQLFDARDELWVLYSDSSIALRDRTSPEFREIQTFIDTESFRSAYRVVPLRAVPVEEIDVKRFSEWLEAFLDQQSRTIRYMQSIQIFLVSVLLLMFGAVHHESIQRSRDLVAQRATHRAIARAEEKERTRIGQDLHDSVGQHLSLALLQLQNDPSDVGESLNHAIRDLRSIAHNLSPRLDDPEAFEHDIRDLIERTQNSSGIEIQFRCHGLEQIAQTTRGQLFRIIQELLSNLTHHSHATIARIRIFPHIAALALRYDDDGIGLPDTSKNLGHGLTNIKNRVMMLDGTVEIIAGPGTTIMAYLPFGDQTP